jgi:hypothetical protein
MRLTELDNCLSAVIMCASIGYPFGEIYKDGIQGREAPFINRITEFAPLVKWGM